MYRKYWGLVEKPFNNTMDHHFLFYSKEHEEALVRMLYTVSEAKGVMLLTGEPGVGKTFLCAAFSRELATKGYQVGMVVDPATGPLEILVQVAYELGLELSEHPSTYSKAQLVRAMMDRCQENLEEGNATIVIVDEAQVIQDENTWEELRLLSNFKDEGHYLLTLILVGGVKLKKQIKAQPELAQRIGVHYQLQSMSERETREYIDHRLRIAGAQREVFSVGALKEIFLYSQGLPLKVNNICDLALLIACSQQAAAVSPRVVQQAVEELVEFSGYARERPN